MFDKLGHQCSRCGFTDKRALQIDHVNGGGNKEHAEIKCQARYLRKVLDDTEGTYQILCANCNWIKRMERLEHRKPVYTEDEIKKILDTNPDGPVSEGTRKRISEAGKGRKAWNVGVPAWNRGVPRPQELKDRLSEIAKGISDSRTSEEKSAIALKREANMTDEQRRERAKAAAATLAQRMADGFQLPRRTPEQRANISEGLRRAYAKKTPEERSEIARKRQAARTPEQRQEASRKRLATMQANKLAQAA